MYKFLAIALTGIMLLLAGCSAPATTNTKRSLIEQLLIASVVERGMKSLDFSTCSGKKVAMDYTYLAPQTDKEFLQGYLEMHLSRNGLIVVKDRKQADLVAQLLCGVLATEQRRLLIGTPNLPVPVPDTGLSIVIPEIPLFSKLTRSCQGRFALNFIEAESSKHLFTVDSVDAYAFHTDWTVLLIPFATNNIPLFRGDYDLDRWDFKSNDEVSATTRLPADIPTYLIPAAKVRFVKEQLESRGKLPREKSEAAKPDVKPAVVKAAEKNTAPAGNQPAAKP